MSIFIPRLTSFNKNAFSFMKLNANGRELISLTQSEQEQARTRFHQIIAEEILNRSMIVGPKTETYTNNVGSVITVRSGYRYGDSGQIEPPSPTEDTFDEKVIVKNKHFHKRRKAGEIVVAPYRIRDAIVRYYPGTRNTIKSVSPAVMKVTQFTSLYEYRQIPLSGKQAFWPSVGYYLVSTNDSAWNVVDEEHEIIHLTPKNLGFAYGAEFFSTICGEHEQDIGLITNANADANKGSIDTLTAVAELPSTISMVVGALGSFTKVLKDFRKGKFQLTQAHLRTFNKIGSDIQSKRKALEKSFSDRLSRAYTRRWPMSAIRELMAKHDKRMAGLAELEKRTKIQATKEFTSAVANLWLAVRYGVLPVVYTFEDYLEYREMLFASYKTTRKRRFHKITLPHVDGFETNISLNQQAHRVWIKRRLNDQMDRKSAQLQHTNILTTAWELIPYSFVADWFVNFGDFVASKSSLETYWSEGASYSVKGDIDASYVHTETGARVVILARNYSRYLINPCELSGLTLQFNLNSFRYLDSVSLLWQKVRRKI